MAKANTNSKSDKMLTLFQHRNFTVAFFLVVFGLLGGAFYLYSSSAATTGTVLYFSKDYRDMNAELSIGEGIGEDQINQVGAVGSVNKIIDLGLQSGSKLVFGGKGGVIDGAPSLLDTKTCYVMRTTDKEATVRIAHSSGYGTRKVVLKPNPTPIYGNHYGNHYWQYECVDAAKKGGGQPVDYAVQHLSGSSIRIDRADTIAKYNY